MNAGSWTSVTFKVTGALQREGVKDIFRPIRWFTFVPGSFADDFTREIDVPEPHSERVPQVYEWYKHPECPVWYRWDIDDDETNRPPVSVQALDDANALLNQ